MCRGCWCQDQNFVSVMLTHCRENKVDFHCVSDLYGKFRGNQGESACEVNHWSTVSHKQCPMVP